MSREYRQNFYIIYESNMELIIINYLNFRKSYRFQKQLSTSTLLAWTSASPTVQDHQKTKKNLRKHLRFSPSNSITIRLKSPSLPYQKSLGKPTKRKLKKCRLEMYLDYQASWEFLPHWPLGVLGRTLIPVRLYYIDYLRSYHFNCHILFRFLIIP